jgi:hypothetical protein
MNLATVVRSFGTLSTISFARKHAEKLSQSKIAEVSSGAETIRSAADSLEQAYAARRPLVTLWKEAVMKKDEADDALDETISEMSYELLGPKLLRGDRGAASYRALFPEGNINFIHGPDRAELAQVNGMVAYLKARPDHPMAERAAELEAKAAALQATLEPMAVAESLLRSAQSVEREKRDALCRALRKSAAVLRAEFMDEKQVDALFPTVKEAKVKEDEEHEQP